MMVYSDIRLYIEKQIDLFELFIIDPDKKRLTPKEKEIFIEIVLHSMYHENINSSEVRDSIVKSSKLFSKVNYGVYKNILKDRGWLYTNPKTDIIEIIPNFNFSKKEFLYSKDYKFKIHYNGDESELNDIRFLDKKKK